jgi:phosphoenolpyruvate-protein phosphotransferase
MKRLHGLGAAPGVVRAPWIRVEPSPIPVGGRTTTATAPDEVARLAQASADAAADLEAIARRVHDEGHPDEAAIFEAQAAIARDPALASMAAERVHGSHEDAIGAIVAAAESFAAQLRSLDDERLAARAADVIDVGDRIARRLAGSSQPTIGLDRPAIVVAQDLAPSLTATLPRERLVGIALEGSSPTAHAAILARAYGIPAVVGVRDLLETLSATGAGELAIDGGSGDVFIDPDQATSDRLDAGTDAAHRQHERDVLDATSPAVTLDGTEVTLLANIGTPDESDAAITLGAQGIGLFRTEFLFLERTRPPSEDEQVAAYRRVIGAFAPHPVTIRLLDVGGDKPLPYLPIGEEANPFLGVRALRLAYTEPDLFVTQLRACYRAAAFGPVKVMAPMIGDAGDADLFVQLAERAREEAIAAGCEIGEVALGVMLEIPSAILVADSYVDRIRFASLGTNDLLQYTLAVDRGNARLERYRDPLHPAILRLVRQAVDAARRGGIELSVCGEMAGDPAAALALVALGVESLSMASSSLPAVRRAIRCVDMRALVTEAIDALDDPSAGRVRARFEAFLVPEVRS